MIKNIGAFFKTILATVKFQKVKVMVCMFLTIFNYQIFAVNQKTSSNYIKVNNGQLYYQTFGVGDPIIVLHGGPGLDHTYLLPQMLELAKYNKVIFYDQRGTGKSLNTTINNKTINIKQFVSDLETLRRNLKLEKFTLIGHSWGGILAMNYAVSHSNRLSSLILLNSSPATYKGFQSFIENYTNIIKPITNDLNTMQNSPEFQQRNPELIKKFYRLIFAKYFFHQKYVNKLSLNFTKESCQNGFIINKLLSENYLLKPYDLRNSLKKLNIPTLIIHASKDPIPLWTVYETQNAIPNSRLVILGKCGHFPFIEQPKVLFKEIKSFLQHRTN